MPVPIFHEGVILRVLRLLLYFLFDLSHALTIHHGMEVLRNVNLLQVLELEGLAVLLSDVLTLGQAGEVEDEVH